MHRIRFVCAALALFTFSVGVEEASAWWNQNWTKRVKLTILNSGQPEAFAGFPLLVRLDSSRIDYADTQNAGQDVRFVDADDLTPLAYEIESWDESGSSFVWVNVPLIDASSNTDFIWMYYGNPTASDGQTPTAVWDAGFTMVHHLKETAGTHFDSTSNDNDSVGVEITTQGTGAGRINGADVFSGTDDVEIADSATLDMGSTDSFTVEAWVRTSNAGQQMIVCKQDGTTQYQLWTDTGGNAKFWLISGATAHAQSSTSVSNNQWRYVVGRWNEATSTAQVFVDGTSVGSAVNAGLGAISNARPLRIGEEADSDPEGGFNFAGTIDEVRISKVARSDNWIRAQHLSMTDSFLSFGQPSVQGIMRVKTGVYTGNGANDRPIFVGFQPDVVFIKRDANCGACGNPEDFEAVVRTSTMVGDATKSLDNQAGLALFAGGVKSLTGTGFTLGTSPRVNLGGQTYYWIAFTAAPGVLQLGTYSGTGPDNRSVTGVGFQPEFVVTLPAAGGAPAGIPWFRSSTMPPDRAYDLDANGLTNKIQIMEPDGFQVGTDQNVNGATYHYVAWNAMPGFVAVGSYSGTGIDPTDYDVVGFQPEWLLIKQDASIRPWVHKPAVAGVSTPFQLPFSEFGSVADNILALRPQGFRVDDHERVNALGNTYHWIAFGPHRPKVNLRSIGTAANTTGTVSVTNGSNIVTGVTGPDWAAANRGRGDAITIPCATPPCLGGPHYTIARVLSPTSLELTDAYAGATNPGITYLIRRQFATPAAWEDCIDGGGTSCGVFPSVSSNLVNDDRSEIGIVYKDAIYVAPLDGTVVRFNGAITDATHTITLTADGINRHYGIPGAGVQFQLNAASTGGDAIEILTRFVTVEWIEAFGGTGADGIELTNTTPAAGKVVIRNNLIHSVGGGIQLQDVLADADVYNNIIYSTAKEGIDITGDMTARILNNTIYNTSRQGIFSAAASNPSVLLRNNIAHTNTTASFSVPGLNPLSSHNLSGPTDASATSHSPAGGGRPNVSLAALAFVDPLSAAKNLHLQGTSFAIDKAADLSGVFTIDIDHGVRQTPWDIGADDAAAATRVKLASFEALGMDAAVELRWETASELDNLGFHLYRSRSESGPYERLTARLIPGLGSSPEGARYRYVDSAVSKGNTYFYKLEDVETSGKKRIHGPVSATPTPSAAPPSQANTIVFGNPESTSVRVVRQNARGLLLEIETDGFTAHPQEDGSVLLEISGFDAILGSPSVPVLRPWLEVPSRSAVRVRSVQASRALSFAGLRPSGAEVSAVLASLRGTVRAGRGRARGHEPAEGLVPELPARILQLGFQGGTRKAQLELAPLRWDGAAGELVLARTLMVELEFEETRGEERGRRSRASSSSVVARLVTDTQGLHEVSFQELFPRGRGVSVDLLRLTRHDESVPFHIEPPGRSFGPGAKLYFVSDDPGANPYGNELVYELELGTRGATMERIETAPSGDAVRFHLQTARHEQNRYYQAALLDAPDRWFWDVLLAPVAKSYSFYLDHLVPGPSKVAVWLQGATDFAADPDHHLRLYLNGVLHGEVTWNGKRDRNVVLDLPPGALREGENRLDLENVGDTDAAYSMVLLDRFEVVYPRRTVAVAGVVEGLWLESGVATAENLGPAHVLDVTDAKPRWISGSTSSFAAEAGRRYLAVSREAVRRPRVQSVPAARLGKATNRAEYLVIGPKEFASVARPLLDHRRRQGLQVAFAAVEDVFSEFGFGEPRPEAIREFLSFAYHHWREPRLRYVLLLGDATYDYKDFLATGVRNQVPPLLVKTSYLWTASDPALAAVNGEDLLPDVAMGRLPAASPEELRVMVEKILAYERGSVGLDGLLLLVSDNPDAAGNFDTNAREIARGPLASRSVRHLSLAALGGSMRSEILSGLDEGASLLSYIGHGGIHLWADENVFNTSDVASLAPQSQQPLLLTMNCLNGYFHFPYFDSLAESFVKAEGKGAIAAFSPSGLSLDAPAHRYHLALLGAIFEEGHGRLGDAVLSAQGSYAASGAFPELLSIYHLLGDPALVLR